MTGHHISRAEWARIESRVKQAKFEFDPKWKCLLDGKKYRDCVDHNVADQEWAISEISARLAERSHI